MSRTKLRIGGATILSAIAIGVVSTIAQQAADPYAQWEVRVRAGTALDTIRMLNTEAIAADRVRGVSGALPQVQAQTEDAVRRGVPRPNESDRQYVAGLFAARIPPADLEDRSPMPLWYRAFVRRNYPLLPENGGYQYPRVARELLEWMLAHQDLRSRPAATRTTARAAHSVTAGGNINITNLDERNSESSIAVDNQAPSFVIAAANNISGSGHQKQFASADGGATWTVSELPLGNGTAFHSDPAVAVASDGIAWSATLGLSQSGSRIEVQLFKSTDHGRTWTYHKTVSTTTNNDKEMVAIDTWASSPFKDNIYVAWDVPSRDGGIRFVASADRGATWPVPLTLSTDRAIGVHVVTGPAGEVYVAWPDTASREIRIRKSMDGGKTFGPVAVIARTNASYEVSIPAMCRRNVLVYVTLGVARSGASRGAVYASWTDREGIRDPGCAASAGTGNTNVYVARSSDGGLHWSSPAVAHDNPPNTDQFNQWLDVDPADGVVHLVFYNTRNDPERKKTDVYYVASKDGVTWTGETRVTTANSDESADPADLSNQYGDYNGLAVFRGLIHPVWTDRRLATGKEQIYTGSIGDRRPVETTKRRR